MMKMESHEEVEETPRSESLIAGLQMNANSKHVSTMWSLHAHTSAPVAGLMQEY